MKNKNLIEILEILPKDAEIIVAVYDTEGKYLSDTFDVGYELTSNRELRLRIGVERTACSSTAD